METDFQPNQYVHMTICIASILNCLENNHLNLTIVAWIRKHQSSIFHNETSTKGVSTQFGLMNVEHNIRFYCSCPGNFYERSSSNDGQRIAFVNVLKCIRSFAFYLNAFLCISTFASGFFPFCAFRTISISENAIKTNSPNAMT